MADSPSPILLQRIQTTGSNTNTWGGYNNNNLETLERAAKGYEALAVTGDATISWTNYSDANTGAVAFLKLTGTVTGVLTFPSYQNYLAVWNANTASVTIKCSGGTGVTLATGQRALLYCDGVDYYNAGPTKFPTADVTFAGKLKGVTAGTDGTDAVNLTQMAAAIAASVPAGTAGTFLNSVADTTRGYLVDKLTVAGDLALSTSSGGGNEARLITHTPYWTAPRSLAFADSPITAVDRDVLLIDTSGGAITVNLPSSGRVIIADTSGNASSNNITVTPAGADTVTFGTIDTDYFASEYRRRGTNWVLGI